MNERRHFPLFLLPFFSSLIVLSPVSNALLPLDKEEEEEEKKKGKPRFCMGVSPAGQIAEGAARLKGKKAMLFLLTAFSFLKGASRHIKDFSSLLFPCRSPSLFNLRS